MDEHPLAHLAGMAQRAFEPEAIGRVGELDPARCRAATAERFDVPVVVSGYESVYRDAVASGAVPAVAGG